MKDQTRDAVLELWETCEAPKVSAKAIRMIENLEALADAPVLGEYVIPFGARVGERLIDSLKLGVSPEFVLGYRERTLLRETMPQTIEQHDAKARLMYPELYA